MSWNDQNKNNGSRDPWGNKNDAPDIDEAIKRFKAILDNWITGRLNDNKYSLSGDSKYNRIQYGII